MVRQGNPRNIKGFADLVQEGLQVRGVLGELGEVLATREVTCHYFVDPGITAIYCNASISPNPLQHPPHDAN